ncbi:hypothetical protein K502DRAFT_341412 [Neoconidiobolus thromboides FSU 785]|nr:hypothetical protein K502DRAFT_341412 [Neoconidiobolus thromboides FSU 785]
MSNPITITPSSYTMTEEKVASKKKLTRRNCYSILLNIITLFLPNKLFHQLGYKTPLRIFRLKEKVLYSLIFLILNGLLLLLLINNIITLSNNSSTYIPFASISNQPSIIYGQYYADIPNNEFSSNNSKSNFYDSSFLYQDRNEVCDNFWNVHGLGTYLPCYLLDFNNSTLLQLSKENKTCLYKTEELKRTLNNQKKKKLLLSYKFIQIHENWIVYKDKVIDLNRLKYLHPNLIKAEQLWVKLIIDKIIDLTQIRKENIIDVTYLIQNSLNYQQLNLLNEFTFLFLFWKLSKFIVFKLFKWDYIFDWNFNGGKVATNYSYLSYKKNGKEEHLSWLQWLNQQNENVIKEENTINELILMEKTYPNLLKYQDNEFKKNNQILAQIEPNYELENGLDYEPLRSIFYINSNGRGNVTNLIKCLKSTCENEYPNTHKLIIVMIDGRSNYLNQLLKLMIDPILPTKDIQASSYLDDNQQINQIKIYAGYYEYINPNYKDNNIVMEQQSKYLKVPLIYLYKLGNNNENNNYCGIRGNRDNLILILSFLNKIHFNLPLNNFDYDFYKSIKLITNCNIKLYCILFTMNYNVIMKSNAIINMLRPFIFNDKVICVHSKFQFQSKDLLLSRLFKLTIVLLINYMINQID